MKYYIDSLWHALHANIPRKPLATKALLETQKACLLPGCSLKIQKFGCILGILLFLFFTQATWAQNFVAGEYFFNTDPGPGKGTPLSLTYSSTTVSATVNIPITGLRKGFQQLFIRFKDQLNRWGIAEQRTFYIDSSITASVYIPPLIKGEYFFDTDPGVGAGKALTVTKGDSLSITTSIAVTGLTKGFHQLFTRYRDSLNRWGIAEQRTFYIDSSITASVYIPPLIKGEYFFDTDPGVGAGKALTVAKGDSLSITTSIAVTGLTKGFHQLFTRFKDSLNRWGVAEQRTFYIDSSITTSAYIAPIVTGEYFFDTDPGIGKGTVLSTGKTDSLSATLTLANTLRRGFHQLFVRYRDSLSRWGVAEQRTFYIDSSIIPAKPVPIVAAEYFTKKDSGIGKCEPLAIIKTDSLNQAYQLAVPSGMAAGTNNIFVRFKDSTGRWSLAEQRTITVVCKPSLGNDTTVKVCPGSYTDITGLYNYTGYASSTWSTPTPGNVSTGSYTLIVKSSLGCSDTAVVTVAALAKPNIGSDSAVYTCLGTAINIKTVYNTAAYTTTTWSTARPDSITVAGTYTLVVTNSTGCKDTAVVTVSNYPKPNLGRDTTVYTCVGTAVNIKNLYSTAAYTTATWNTARPDSVTAAGSYTLIVTNSNGCKDTAVVTVSNYPKPNLGRDTTVYTCIGTAINIKTIYNTTAYTTATWNTARPDSITVAGAYTLVVTNSTGCKDTAVVTVSNYPKPNLGRDTTVYTCIGTAINIKTLYNTAAYTTTTWNTARPDSVTAAGSYTLIVTNSNGCKDTAVVTVSNYPKPNLGKDSTVYTCLGTAINIKTIYNTTAYTTATWSTARPDSITVAGAYTLVVANSNGCKDTAVVTVSNYPKPNLGKDTTVTINSGATVNITSLYNLTGLTAQYSTATPTSVGAGTYMLIATNSNGCKDTAIITVKVNAATVPVIYSFSPTTGGAGITVTIKGRYFTGATVVSFGGTAATSFTVVNDSVITAVTGLGASGVVLVTAPGGTATLAGFSFCSPVAPSVAISANIASPICTGTKVTFTATATNGGTPVYQWYKDNAAVGTNAATYTDSLLKNSDSVWCIITSNAACITTTTAKSNVLKYVVNTAVAPSVAITSSIASPICTGTKVTFTATATNGGTPVYQWYKDNAAVGTNAATYTDSLLKNSDSVWCSITSNAACITTTTAKSNVMKYLVNATAAPSVAITSSIASPICTGTKVTFTAAATNGGTPVYQWYKDNAVVGTNAATYTDSLLKNSDSVWCSITSNAACITTTTAKSNVMKYVVNATAAPSVAITSSIASPICTGTKVTFTATATNGGTPVYQWYKDNAVVGTNTATYTDSLLKNSDSVWCVITSNAACITTTTAKSNVLKYVVNATAAPSVTIASNIASPICTGTKVTFTAAATNGGTPVYQWYKDNAVVGTNTSTYADSLLKNSDSVWCIITSNAACLTTTTAKSNVLKYVVNTAVAPSATITSNVASPICTGAKVTFTATATNGGTPVYQWYKDNTVVGTNTATYTDSLLKNSDSVWCIITSNAACITTTIAKSNVLNYVVSVPVVSISGAACTGSLLTLNSNVPLSQITWLRNGIAIGNAKDSTYYLPNATTVAGGNGQGGAANQLGTTWAVFVDAANNIYVTDRDNNRVQKWAPGATTGVTVAGGNGQGSAANQIYNPLGLWVDSAGSIYVADNGNNRVQKWAPGATTGVTVAGGNGPGPGANQFNVLAGIYVDKAGNIYAADAVNSRIQKWAPGAAAGVTVAGGNGQGAGANQLSIPYGIYLDSAKNMYIADNGNNRVQKWAAGATSGITVAGGNGQGSAANQLNQPLSAYADAKGNVFVPDYVNYRVQEWAQGATTGITVAGGNGNSNAANQLSYPASIYIDTKGNMYVADAGNFRVQKFSLKDSLANTRKADSAGVYSATIVSTSGCTATASNYTVNASVAPSVAITSSIASPICAGTKVTFTATATNGGTPVYQWYKDNAVVGTNAATYTDSLLKNSDSVWCVITSNAACITTTTAKSNVLKYVVNAAAAPGVTITSNIASPICTATKVTFTATASNGGTPVYQWYKDNAVVGTNAATYTDSLLKNSDSVWCIITSNAACLTTTTAKSNVMKYVVNATAAPSVTITSNIASPICTGTKVTLTATASNGGTPVYQWYKDNAAVGTNAATYTDSLLKNSDSVWCVITSNAACITTTTAKSNVLKYVVNAAVAPSVNISTNTGIAICAGTPVTFTATVLNSGTSPVYQWKKNGVNVGTNSATYTDSLLKNGDSINMVFTISTACTSAMAINSNSIKIIVNAVPVLTVTGTGCGAPTVVSSINAEQVLWEVGGTVSQSSVAIWQSTPVIAAGTGTAGSALTQLNSPGESFVDAYGNIYISDRNNSRVVKWAPGATTGVLVAGGNGAGSALNQLSTPVGVWVDANANLYVVEYGNNRVTKWAPGATAGVIVAGTGTSGSGLNQFAGPHSVVGDNAGNIYVTDQGNNRVTKWAPGATTGIAVIAAGQVGLPQGIAIDASNNLYVAEYSNARVTKWAPGAAGGTVVAGTGVAGTAYNQLSGPIGVFVDKTGVIFVSDYGNNRVQSWLPSTGATGGVSSTQFNKPLSAAVDSAGNLIVLEEFNNRVLKFSGASADGALHILTPGAYTAVVSSYAGCTATSATYNLVAPTTPSVTITSSTGPTICAGTPVTFTATAVNGGTAPVYQWKKNGVNAGTNSAVYTDSLPVNGDSIVVILTSNASCVATNGVASNGIKLTVNAKPNLGRDTSATYCTGGTAINIKTLYSTTGYATAAWNITRPDSVFAAGHDSLFVANTFGCRDTAVVTVAAVAPPAIPTITQTGKDSFCLGSSLVLAANVAAGNTMQWYRDNGAIKLATTGTYTVRLSGTYQLKVTGSSGCTALSAAVVAVVSQVPTPTITLVNDTLVSSAATGNQWFEDGVLIPGATGSKYSPNDIDVYTVQVTSGPCTSQMSDQFIYAAGTNGIKRKIAVTGNAKVLLYPNPATDVANIQLSGFTGGVIVTITDMAGKVVWQHDKLTNSSYTLPLSNLASGMYIVTVRDVNNIKSLKLIKAK